MAGRRSESGIALNRDRKTSLRSNANSMLTTRPSDGPQAKFANNASAAPRVNAGSDARQKTNMPMAAANIKSVVSPTETKLRRELGWFCMIFRSEATSQTPTSRKGASRPLMIAVQ